LENMSRLSLVILLCLLPTVLSLKCIVGGDINGVQLFDELPCTAAALYCYKMTTTLSNGLSTMSKNCDPGIVCTKTGCTSSTNGVELCCCKTDDCNGAAGASLLMTSLVAIGAAWAWS
ncbi:hypothetical protein PMAYCL1PPCAC_13649, partial [Pristionchus mayeri]